MPNPTEGWPKVSRDASREIFMPYVVVTFLYKKVRKILQDRVVNKGDKLPMSPVTCEGVRNLERSDIDGEANGYYPNILYGHPYPKCCSC